MQQSQKSLASLKSTANGNAVSVQTAANSNIFELPTYDEAQKWLKETQERDRSQTCFPQYGVYQLTDSERPVRGTWVSFNEKLSVHNFVTDGHKIVRIKDSEFLNQCIRRAFKFEFECIRDNLVEIGQHYSMFTIRYLGPKKSQCGKRILRHLISIEFALYCDLTGHMLANTTFKNWEMSKWEKSRRDEERKSPIYRPFSGRIV